MTEQEAWEEFFSHCNKDRFSSVKMIFDGRLVAQRPAIGPWAVLDPSSQRR